MTLDKPFPHRTSGLPSGIRVSWAPLAHVRHFWAFSHLSRVSQMGRMRLILLHVRGLAVELEFKPSLPARLPSKIKLPDSQMA